MVKRIISFIMCLAMMVLVAPLSNAQAEGFSDLPSKHWAYNAVSNMVSNGVLKGYEDGTFKPDAPVTREEFAKILVLALNLQQTNSGTQTFSDVSTSSWAYPYVEAAKQYLTGYKVGDTMSFRGSQNAVREDMAVAIVGAKGLSEETPDLTIIDIYADKNYISVNLRGYVAIAAKNKIMEGDGTNFNPQKTLTRAEACALIYKSSIAQGTGTKVVVADAGIGKDYKIYNDGNVTFKYPSEFEFEKYNMSSGEKEMDTSFSNMSNVIAKGNGVALKLSYEGGKLYDPEKHSTATTLDELYRIYNNYEVEMSKLDNYYYTVTKYDNCFAQYTSTRGQSNNKVGGFKILARGIGDAIPEIKINNGEALEEGYDIDVSYSLMGRTKDMIAGSLEVINPKQHTGITVVSIDPVAGSTNVDPSKPITITFSEPIKTIDMISISVKDSLGNDFISSGTYVDGTKLVLKTSMAAATRYTVSIPQVIGASGSVLNPYSFNVTTKAADTTKIMTGDVNQDGQITSTDLDLITNVLLKKATLTVQQNKAADVNGDGVITSLDLALINSYLNGTITEFPAK